MYDRHNQLDTMQLLVDRRTLDSLVCSAASIDQHRKTVPIASPVCIDIDLLQKLIAVVQLIGLVLGIAAIDFLSIE